MCLFPDCHVFPGMPGTPDFFKLTVFSNIMFFSKFLGTPEFLICPIFSWLLSGILSGCIVFPGFFTCRVFPGFDVFSKQMDALAMNPKSISINGTPAVCKGIVSPWWPIWKFTTQMSKSNFDQPHLEQNLPRMVKHNLEKYDFVYILDKVNKPAIAAKLAGIIKN